MLGTYWGKCRREASQEKGLRVMVDIRLNMNQQCALTVKRANTFWGISSTASLGNQETGLPCCIQLGVASLGVLCAVMVPTILGKCEDPQACP